MTSTTDILQSAMQVWSGRTAKPGDNAKAGDKQKSPPLSSRDAIDDLWLGSECGFLKALREALTEISDVRREKPEDASDDSDSVVGILNQLCEEFTADVQSLDGCFDSSNGFDPLGVFRHEDWDQQLATHTDEYWKVLSADQAVRRNSIGQKLLASFSDAAMQHLTPRFSLLAAAMAFSGRAALVLKSWDATEREPPKLFLDDVGVAVRCVNAMWPLLTGPLQKDGMKSGLPRPEQEHKATIAMRRMLHADLPLPNVPTSAWLTTLHLLRWLLGESTECASPAATIHLQMIDTSSNQGRSVPLVLQADCEAQTGGFIDLVQTGLLLPDPQMLESLNIAWEIGCHRLTDRATQNKQTWALRIAFPSPSGIHADVREIGGNSAGGMAALGMYAVADGKMPDERVTGSFSIRRKDNNRRVERLDDVIIGGVAEETLVGKVINAGDKCRHFLIFDSEGQMSNRVQIAADQSNVRLIGLRNQDFSVGLTAVTNDARLDDQVARLLGNVAAAWQRLSHAASAADHSSPIDRDENETHRFDCYVQPDYHVERPLSADVMEQHAKPSREQDTPETRSSEYQTPVPGDGDEKLRQLLRVMRGTDLGPTWNDMPDWLKSDQKKYGPRWLVVYDNAGVGKTVFTHRIAHVIAQQQTWDELFDGHAPLVVRREGSWPRRNGEFLTLEQFLIESVEADCRAASHDVAEKDIRKAVEFALRRQRVVIVLDGFDQFDTADRKHVVKLLSSRSRNRSDKEQTLAVESCQWIVAGRVHVIDEHRQNDELFDDRHWVRVRIDPFSQDQQDAYFAQPGHGRTTIGDRWMRLVGITPQTSSEARAAIRERMDHLLQLPMTLWYLRWLVENTPVGDPLPVFRTLSELSVISGRRMLERALQTSAENVKSKLAADGIVGLFPNDPARQLKLLEHVLSLIAFQMMLEQNYNGRVTADAVNDFKDRCRKRFVREAIQAVVLARNSSNDPDAQFEVEDRLKSARQSWLWAWSVLEAIELKHLTVTERFLPQGLAFRSRKMVEANAARYLTRYATEWDIWGRGRDFREDTHDDLATVCLFDFSNDPEWKHCWMQAIEMPRHPGWHRIPGRFADAQLDPAVTLQSLSVLLEQPKREIRPNELAYHAWPLLEYDDRMLRERLFLAEASDELRYGAELSNDFRRQLGEALILPGADAILNRFRNQASRDLVQEMKSLTLKWDRAPLKETADHQQWLEEWQRQCSHDKSRTFLQCPPQKWLDADPDANVNVMGSNDNDGDEKPQHRVRVRPYHMAATPVTQGIYAMFDTAFLNSTTRTSQGSVIAETIRRCASPPKGATGEESIPQNYPVNMTDWFDSVMFCKWLGPEFCLPSECQHEFGIRGGSRGNYCFGDNPDESWLSEFAWWGVDGRNHAHAVGLKRANEFGLFDVHGQVWERSHDWFDDSWYKQRAGSWNENHIHDEDIGPASGVSRSLRGSSFCDYCNPNFSRSSHRGRYAPGGRGTPVDRHGVVGFRVVWLRSSPQ